MRILFYTILVTLGLSLSIIILAPSFFDINTYKSKLYELVFKQTGYTLSIKGPMEISIFPKLKLNAEKITLNNKNEPLFKAEKLTIFPSIFSFFRGNLNFESISINKALLFIKKNKSNEYNWSYSKLEKKTNEKNFSENNKTLEKQKKENFFIIKNLLLENSIIYYSDLERKDTIENINLNFKEQRNKDFLLKGHFTVKGYKNKVNYKASILNQNKIKFSGEIGSDFYNLNSSGIYNYIENSGSFDLAGNIKAKNFLTHIKELRSDNLKINTKINLNKKSLSLDNLKIISKNTEFEGKANLNFLKKQKKISIKLFSDKIDINDFYKKTIPLSKDNNSKNKNIENKKISSGKDSKKVNNNIFGPLEDFNLNAEILANQVKYKNIYFEKVLMQLTKKKNINVNINAENFFNSLLKTKFTLNAKLDFFADINIKNLSLQDLNKLYNTELISGKISLASDLQGDIMKKEKIYNTITGTTLITSEELVINNLNLNSLKTDIMKLKNLEDLKGIRKNLFNGNTNIKDQKIKLIHDKGLIKVPLTKIKVGNDYIITSGVYNINKRKINLTSNYNDANNLLSLFSLNTSGKVNNPLTKLSFNEGALTKILEKITKKQMKKVLEKKLEDKFDNIIENLLQ